ncbi:MAG: PKD domain-containing protein, partial [Planctomycetota bacterium]
MKRSVLLGLAPLLIAATLASAATRSVPGDYTTIQQAIDDCNDADVVVVEPGTYFETINFFGKNIVLTGTDPDDPEIVASTIIDGDGEGSVVTFENGETSEAVLTGFTIAGGYGTTNTAIPEADYVLWGAGIYCLNSSPTIRANVIMHNIGPLRMENDLPVALGYGGGIACVESSPIITNNIIKNNSGYAGGAIMLYLGDATIRNNLIFDNSAVVGGGVIMLLGGRLVNNTIVSNDASLALPGVGGGFGGNVYTESSPELGLVRIVNNIICNAKSGGGLFLISTGEDLVAFNNVWDNAGGNYGSMNLQTGEQIFDGEIDRTGKDGNISQDPLFAGPQSNDYHLLLNSPCISAGDPAFVGEPGEIDIDGDPRIFAAAVDIGADEYIGYVKPVANAGPDQHVDLPRLITLDGSGSFFYDPNGAATFEWEQFAGPEVQLSDSTSVQTQFTPQADGEYRFALIVSDGTHSSRVDEVLIVVSNRPPVADAGPDQSWSSAPVIVTLDGSGSYDPGDQAVTYRWRQISGPAVELSDNTVTEPTFAPPETGVCVFELVVNDGLTDSVPDIVGIAMGNRAPTADAGSSRYAAVDPVILDGANSFDRDGYGELTYEWRQVAGQSLDIADASTATPTVSGFMQTSTIQRCVFELIVSDGDLLSRPDAVEIIIVPSFSGTTLVLENPPFDPDKPTFIFFGGGNGGSGLYAGPPWEERANMISFSTQHNGRRWPEHANAIIVYLSSKAPNYRQRIQTSGFSKGARLPIVVGAYINTTYADSRYNV